MNPKLIVSILMLLIFSGSVLATDLRGKVVRFDPYTRNYYPLANLRVDILYFNGQQLVPAAYTFTGPDGMYYFYRFSPGIYFHIQINGVIYPPRPLLLTNVALFDIPQLLL